jgi:hypothetical protein
MPCDSVQQSKVEFLATSTDLDLLTKALEKMGWTVTRNGDVLNFSKGYYETGSFNKKTGRMTLPESADLDEIKRGYSEEVVTTQAKKHGWQVSWSTNKAGKREALVVKR